VAERLRAERKVGAWLRENVRHGGDRQSEKASYTRCNLKTPDGITHHERSKWQRMAAIDEADFETWVQECLNDRELSTAGALRLWRFPNECIDDEIKMVWVCLSKCYGIIVETLHALPLDVSGTGISVWRRVTPHKSGGLNTRRFCFQRGVRQ
jgi:hypothetical protein